MGSPAFKDSRGSARPPSSGTQSIAEPHAKPYAAEAVRRYLSVYLGPSTASAAVTGCCHALGLEPESLELRNVPELLAALRPMLGTLLGDASGRILLHRILQELGS
jgi:hypothetical protein